MAVFSYKTCDKCGKVISEAKHKEDYFVTTIRIISKGQQFKHPSCYLCVDCFKKCNLPLFPSGGDD